MDLTRFLAFVAAIGLWFVWLQLSHTRSRFTRVIGAVVILGGFVVFSWISGKP